MFTTLLGHGRLRTHGGRPLPFDGGRRPRLSPGGFRFVPILSIYYFVPSESTMHLPLDKLVTRFAFFVFLILVAAAVLVEVIRIALGS